MTQLLLEGQAVKAHSHDVKLGAWRWMKGDARQLIGLNEWAKAAPLRRTQHRSELGSSESLLCSLEMMSVTVNTSLIEMRINMFRNC